MFSLLAAELRKAHCEEMSSELPNSRHKVSRIELFRICTVAACAQIKYGPGRG